MSYQTDYDTNLNKKDSLLNDAANLSSLDDILNAMAQAGLSADSLSNGVFGATSDTTGIEFGSSGSLSYIQSRNFVSGSTGFRIASDGTIQAYSITLTGGTISYGKTSFSDSTNAGYYISSAGLYFGAASDTTYLKYTVATGTLNLVGTVSGRSTATLASAITSGGNFIDAALDTSAKMILSDFTFSPSDYSGAFKIGNITWNTTTGAVTGGTGILINKLGIVGANAGVTTFTITTAGNATFAGNLSAAYGSIESIDVTTARYLEEFEAGENISSGDIVCITPSYTDYSPTDDSYTAQGVPDANYGSSNLMFTGVNSSNAYISWLKFNETSWPQAHYILKATLNIKLYQKNNSPTAPAISGAEATWDEDTITWNTQPAYALDISDYGSQDATTMPSDGNWISIDVTQWVRNWKDGNIDNHGFALTCSVSGANDSAEWYTKEATDSSNRPYLRIWSGSATDGTVYKTIDSDYFLCRSIIGVAQEAITSGNTGIIQTHGKITNMGGTGAGGRAYVSSNYGTYTTSTSNLNRTIPLGKISSDGNLIWNPKDSDIFIEKLYTQFNSANLQYRYYAPVDARYVILRYINTSDNFPGEVILYRESAATAIAYFPVDATNEASITWSANYVTLGAGSYTAQLYFYT